MQPLSDDAFGTAWLGLTGRLIPGAEAGVMALLPKEGADPVISHWPTGGTAHPALLASVRQALETGRGMVVPGAVPDQAASVAYPARMGETTIGACAFQIAPGHDPRHAVRHLQWAAAWLRDLRRRRDAEVSAEVARQAATALDLLSAALDETGFESACRASATELAARFGCERVAIGFSRRQKVVIAGISHTARFGRSMDLVRLLADAMDEAIDQRGPILFPTSDDAVVVTRAHAALAAAHVTGFVFTVPMFVRDSFAGAVTFERAPDRPFDQAAIDLADAVVAVLGPALLDKRDLDRPLYAVAGSAIAHQAVHLFGPGYWGRKLSLAAVLACVTFGYLAHGPYRVAAHARLEGAVQRAMAAPFDGFIAEASVKAGETVRKDQVIASLDDRDLVLERQRWSTQRQQFLAEFDQALSQGRRADVARFRAQMDEATAQVRLIDEQLTRAKITAPFDGLIVSGDLSQSIGAPVRRGDVLFELAPLDDYRVVLRVPEAQVADIEPGQRGILLVSALPDLELPLTLRRLVPVAEARDGKVVFQADASLDAASPRLRPGMEGLAKIDTGNARLVWIWFRSLLHWARIETWAWLR